MLGLDLNLSLSRQLEMVLDRRRAAHMNRDQLAHRCDELIQTCHQQQHLIIELQRVAGNLQVQLALAGPPVPVKRGPEPKHVAWAAEVITKLVEDGVMVPPVEVEA